jgi:hypothetical protein
MISCQLLKANGLFFEAVRFFLVIIHFNGVVFFVMDDCNYNIL